MFHRQYWRGAKSIDDYNPVRGAHILDFLCDLAGIGLPVDFEVSNQVKGNDLEYLKRKFINKESPLFSGLFIDR